MKNVDPQHATARLLRSADDPGSASGMGFLVDSTHLMTCAHVVAAALGDDSLTQIPEDSVVYAFFPFDTERSVVRARVICFHPRDGADTLRADVAVLELEEERPASVRPIPLVTAEDLEDKSFKAFGHPTRFAGRGIIAKGEMRGWIEDDRLQCEQRTSQGVMVQRGFSGTAAWCEELDGAIGMVSGFAPGHGAQEGEGISIVIPTDVLTKAWPALQIIVQVWEWSRNADEMRELEAYADAIACCDKGLALDDQNVALLLTKGESLDSLKNYEEALKCVNAVLSIDENLEEALAEQGYLLHKLGRRNESNEQIGKAIEVYDLVLVKNKENWDVLESKAWGLLDLGRNREALECVDKALQNRRHSADAWTTKAEALLALWLKSEKKPDAQLRLALTCVDAALSLKEGADCRALSVKGDVLRAFGRNGEAKDAYSAVITSRSTKPNKDTLLRALTGKAEILSDGGDWKGAAACLDTYLSKEQDAPTLNYKGVCLHSSDLFDNAVECFSESLKMNPEDAQVWYNKGSGLEKLARYGEAIVCYDEALAPTRKASEELIADATFHKAECLWRSVNYLDAITYYDEFLALPSSLDDKTNEDVRDALNEKGYCLENLGRYEDAIDSFSKCLESFPDAVIYANKARCLLAVAKSSDDPASYYGKAMDCANSALELNDSYAEALYRKGLIERFQNRYDEAIRSFDAVIAENQSERDANDEVYVTEAWFSKGNTFVMLAKYLSTIGHESGATRYYTLALECLKKAVERKPEHTEALLAEAACYQKLGQTIQARKLWTEALKIDRNDPRPLSSLMEEVAELQKNLSQSAPVAPQSRPPLL